MIGARRRPEAVVLSHERQARQAGEAVEADEAPRIATSASILTITEL